MNELDLRRKISRWGLENSAHVNKLAKYIRQMVNDRDGLLVHFIPELQGDSPNGFYMTHPKGRGRVGTIMLFHEENQSLLGLPMAEQHQKGGVKAVRRFVRRYEDYLYQVSQGNVDLESGDLDTGIVEPD